MDDSVFITASMLYDLVQCPHRPTKDLYGNPADRDEASPFLQLLWQRGASFELEVIRSLRELFLDLSQFDSEEKEQRTTAAMAERVPLIYSGRLRVDDLLGEPDLLRLEADGYIPGDIKSGSGEESDEEGEGRPKKHYAVQLALYIDLLERLGRSGGRRGFIWDIHREEIDYDFLSPQGVRNPRTLWDEYLGCLSQARTILRNKGGTQPAYGSVCKNCHRKETFVLPSYPHFATFKRLTDQEEALDLLSSPDIGYRRVWDNLLLTRGIQIEKDHNVVVTGSTHCAEGGK
jgi:hypothetical protein